MEICARNNLGVGRAASKNATAKTMVTTRVRGLLLVVAACILGSCGGSDSTIGIGGGQNPDPVLVDYPLLYVRKPFPVDAQGAFSNTDIREMLAVEFGADLYMRDRASVSAPEINITGAITNGFGDVRDVSVSADGTRVLFSMRTPIDPNANDEDQPSWNIWEYNLQTAALRRIFQDDITAEEGHDLGAQYLPDGRIIFTSTRQNRSVAKLLDDGKPQFAALDEDQAEPAFVLHVMDEDGSNLKQISFNQSHDLYPTVMANGRIMFSRWDGILGNNQLSIYSANPDGMDLQLLYGADSHATGTGGATVQFVKMQEMIDGSVLSMLMPFDSTMLGGDLVLIDVVNYLNNTQTNVANQGVLNGPAQVPATVNNVLTIPGPSPGGRFTSAWPLRDGTNRLIVSWSLCRVEVPDPDNLAGPPLLMPCTDANLQNPSAVEADPVYGIWLYDLNGDITLPIVTAEQGFMYTDAVVARPLDINPGIIPDGVSTGLLDPGLLAEDAGILDIRSVYDRDGVDIAQPDIVSLADPALTAADQRAARFIRVYKAVGIPDDETYDFDFSAFGLSTNFGMRELVGYAPIEPDGSVRIKVPADTPLTLDVTDRQGYRIYQRHSNWLQVRPGEEVSCGGCHERNSGLSHGRADAFASVYAGAAGNGVAFPNTDPLLVPTVNMGETMAQARTSADASALELSVDLHYADVWTYPPDAGRAPDAPFDVEYASLITPPPEMTNCMPWTVSCRVLINYETHIQPLWDVSRPVIDPMTMLEIDNHRCIDCHALRDAGGMFIDPDARGQLELTSDPSAAQPLHFVSYRELLVGDFLEEIRDGTVQDVLVDNGLTDINGDPVLEPVPIPSPLSVGGANASTTFFGQFAATGGHPGWLNEAELKLVAEWLDMGAQYFNNPFEAPEN